VVGATLTGGPQLAVTGRKKEKGAREMLAGSSARWAAQASWAACEMLGHRWAQVGKRMGKGEAGRVGLMGRTG
jgi:hypothetical protein